MINEMKTEYQKNLLIGTITSGLLLLGAVIALTLDNNSGEIISLEDHVIIDKWPTVSREDISFPDVVEGSSLDIYSVNPGFDMATKGHAFKPKLSYKKADGQMTIEPGFSIVPIAIDISDEASGFNIPTHYDPDCDYYMDQPVNPRDKILRNIPMSIYDHSRSFTYTKKKIDRPVLISNLYVQRPPNTLGIIGMDDIEDTVFIQVTIDCRGHILDMETIYENPPCLGFAEKFKEAIANASITPARVNGENAGGSFLIYCIFSRQGGNAIYSSEKVSIR